MKRLFFLFGIIIGAFTAVPAFADCETGYFDVDNTCIESKFRVTTIPLGANTTFSFYLTAQGTFYIDWGDGTTETITRVDTTSTPYSHTYNDVPPEEAENVIPQSYTIHMGGLATGYMDLADRWTNRQGACINFKKGTRNLLSSIDGSLGAIFPTIGSIQPLFLDTFSGCANLTSEIPANLFSGLSGTVYPSMFNCLFCNSGITGNIPGNLFQNLKGTNTDTFSYTFYNCSGLTGEIPENLFSGTYGLCSSNLFDSTFYGCTNLTGFIPPNLFAGLVSSSSSCMTNPFGNTGLATSCPAGKHSHTTGFESFFNGKVSCAICPDDKMQYDDTCIDAPFTLVTTSTNSFQSRISAAGTFYIDCGNGGILSGTGTGSTLSGKKITRTTQNGAVNYTCTWETPAVQTIRYGGAANGYSNSASYGAIRFNISGSDSDSNAPKIAKISGSLGAIFGTIAKPKTGYGQPLFNHIFHNASNMRGSLPPNLFTGISGQVNGQMFYEGFKNCSKLTGPIPSHFFGNISGTPKASMFYRTFWGANNIGGTDIPDPNNPGKNYAIPPDLFSGISGPPAESMYLGTFYKCHKLAGTIPSGLFGNISGPAQKGMYQQLFTEDSLLIGSIPSGLFGNITGAPKSNIFRSTFSDCAGLTGSIPSGLFGNLNGAPAEYMFYNTFSSCSKLTGYIPEDLFGNITGAPAQYMFSGTFSRCSGLKGFTNGSRTLDYIPGDFFGNITDGSATDMVKNMFYNTGLKSSCPSGTYATTRSQFSAAGKPWCSPPCPVGTFKPSSLNICYPHILHVGDNNIYLRSTKLTTPSLNVGIGEDVFYANMTLTPTYMNSESEHYLKIQWDDNTYYVCDDTTCGE